MSPPVIPEVRCHPSSRGWGSSRHPRGVLIGDLVYIRVFVAADLRLSDYGGDVPAVIPEVY